MNYRGLTETLETEHAHASATEMEVTGDVEKVLQMLLEDSISMRRKLQLKTFQCKQEAAAECERQIKKQRGDYRRSRSMWRAGLQTVRQTASGQPSTVAGTE